VTDGRTDRRTDGRTEFSSLYRVCITCIAVITDARSVMQPIDSPKVAAANYIKLTEARSVMTETESSPSKNTTCSANICLMSAYMHFSLNF